MKKILFGLAILIPIIICEWKCSSCGGSNPDVIEWCDYCGKTR